MKIYCFNKTTIILQPFYPQAKYLLFCELPHPPNCARKTRVMDLSSHISTDVSVWWEMTRPHCAVQHCHMDKLLDAYSAGQLQRESPDLFFSFFFAATFTASARRQIENFNFLHQVTGGNFLEFSSFVCFKIHRFNFFFSFFFFTARIKYFYLHSIAARSQLPTPMSDIWPLGPWWPELLVTWCIVYVAPERKKKKEIFGGNFEWPTHTWFSVT